VRGDVQGEMIKLTKSANMVEEHLKEPLMDTMTAADAKTNFGVLLDKAQREPVTISKNGRPVAVVMSVTAYEEQQRLKLELLRQEVNKGLDDLKRGRVVSAKEAFARLDRELGD
jgi:prevent-host-death family protein